MDGYIPPPGVLGIPLGGASGKVAWLPMFAAKLFTVEPKAIGDITPAAPAMPALAQFAPCNSSKGKEKGSGV